MNHSNFLRQHFVSLVKLFYKFFKPISIQQGGQIYNNPVAACGNSGIYDAPQVNIDAPVSY